MNNTREQALKLALHSTAAENRLKAAIEKELKLRDEGKCGIMNNITTAELICLAYQLDIKLKG